MPPPSKTFPTTGRSVPILPTIKSDKKKALNIDLWDRLLNLLDIYDVSCHWIKGHSTNYYNNRCDEMAVQERLKLE